MNKPTVPEVLPLVQALYSGEAECSRGTGGVGGHLHIVLDDGNTGADSTQFCIREAERDNCETCLTLARLLAQMSTTQRNKIYNTPMKRGW